MPSPPPSRRPSVVLLHAGFEILSGGYVGVDIFFVISGYLITSSIISELEPVIGFWDASVHTPALRWGR